MEDVEFVFLLGTCLLVEWMVAYLHPSAAFLVTTVLTINKVI